MKCRVAQAVLITVLAGMVVPGLAQKNYYVVVGAFSTEGTEKQFTTHLPVLNADTAYAMSGQDHVVQMYVLKTSDPGVAISKSQLLQRGIEGSSGMAGDYESVFISNLPEGKSVTVTKPLADNLSAELIADASSAGSSSPSGGGVATAPMKPKGKLFKFTISDQAGRTMPGKVHFVDLARERDLAAYSADAYADILNPGKNNNLAVVCGLFGYKQTEKFINYSDPSMIEGVYQDENGAWIIPYKLERLEKGDVSVMYNVSFHKDAAVMLPQSRVDLDELVYMMQQNPGYEITIHGHCNGKNERKIIAPGPDCFDIQGSTQFVGSAKELSQLRSDVVRSYLVANGIDGRRIKIFAWGGRYQLVDPYGSAAKLNDRIEIEIRKD